MNKIIMNYIYIYIQKIIDIYIYIYISWIYFIYIWIKLNISEAHFFFISFHLSWWYHFDIKNLRSWSVKYLHNFNIVCHDLSENDLTKFFDVSQLLCLALHFMIMIIDSWYRRDEEVIDRYDRLHFNLNKKW